MKKVITRRRVCMYDVSEDKIISIFGECYNPNLSDQDILCVVYNPRLMDWIGPYLWIKNSNIRLEIINEYAETQPFLNIWKRIKEVRFF